MSAGAGQHAEGAFRPATLNDERDGGGGERTMTAESR